MSLMSSENAEAGNPFARRTLTLHACERLIQLKYVDAGLAQQP